MADDKVFHQLEDFKRDSIITVGDGANKNNYAICKKLNEMDMKHIHVWKEVNLDHIGNDTYIRNIDDLKLNELYNKSIVTIRYSSIEGFGIPILESLFAGTPIILKRLPIFEEILGNKYPLFIDSLDELPDSIEYAKEHRENVISYFDTIKSKYTINTMAENMKKYYKKVSNQ